MSIPAPHPPEPGTPPKPGAENYVLGPEIARGGMGAVLEALDGKLSRTVAVKVLLPDGDSDEPARRRFLREAGVLARLEHPNIVPIHDIVWEDGTPLFYTMKLVKGRTLQRILDALREGDPATLREFPLRRLLAVFGKVCDAVAFAHSRGVLHRDLKPENIMTGEFGEVLVMDWGVAKLAGAPDTNTGANGGAAGSSAAGYTMHGAVIGTPGYMSPEQARGDVAAHDERSDVFSLGAILHAILTLRPPGDGVDDADGPPLPHCPSGRVPGALRAVAGKALSPRKEDRYQAASDLSAEIERHLAGYATNAEAASVVQEFSLLLRRHRTISALLTLLLAVTVGFLLKVIAGERRAQQAAEAERRAHAAAAIALADARLRDGDSPAMRAALDTVPPDLRDATWRYLHTESDPSRPPPETGLASFDDHAPHPARRGVFAFAGGGRVVLVNLDGGARLLEFMPALPPPALRAGLRLAFSRDGSRLAVGSATAGGIAIHRTTDGASIAKWTGPRTGRLEFHPDGSKLLILRPSRRRAELCDAATGAVLSGISDDFMVNAAFTGDGNALVAYTWPAQLHLASPATGAQLSRLAENFFSEFASRPGSPLVVAGSVLGTIKGFDTAESRQTFEIQPHASSIARIAFLPGGTRFVTAASLPDGRLALQSWNSNNGTPCHQWLGGGGEARILSLHPLSGELVITGASGTRIWDTGSRPVVREFQGENLHPSAAFWGGEDVIFAPSGRKSAALQRIDSDAGVPLWQNKDSDYGQPSVSADGRRAAIGRYDSDQPICVIEHREGTFVEIASVTPPGALDFLRISPDGRHLLVVHSRKAKMSLLAVDEGTAPPALEDAGAVRITDAGWIAGGTRFAALVTMRAQGASAASEERLLVWDATTGRIASRTDSAGIADVLVASPDGAFLATAGADRMVRIRDAATLAVVREFRAHNGLITAMAWHPSRPLLATAGEDFCIRLWDTAGGTRLDEIRGTFTAPTALSFSPSGRRITCAARDGAARVWEPRSLATE